MVKVQNLVCPYVKVKKTNPLLSVFPSEIMVPAGLVKIAGILMLKRVHNKSSNTKQILPKC